MKTIIIFALGVILGTLIPVVGAMDAKIVGDGFLHGVSIEVDGEEVCSTPYYHRGTKTLECEAD